MELILEGEDFQQIYLNILEYIESNGKIIGKSKENLRLDFVLNNPVKSLINLRKNWQWCFTEAINRFSFKK